MGVNRCGRPQTSVRRRCDCLRLQPLTETTNSGFAEHLDFLEIANGAMEWDVLEKEENPAEGGRSVPLLNDGILKRVMAAPKWEELRRR